MDLLLPKTSATNTIILICALVAYNYGGTISLMCGLNIFSKGRLIEGLIEDLQHKMTIDSTFSFGMYVYFNNQALKQ